MLLCVRRRTANVAEDSSNLIVGWYELERLLLSMLPQHTGKPFIMYSYHQIYRMMYVPYSTHTLVGHRGGLDMLPQHTGKKLIK